MHFRESRSGGHCVESVLMPVYKKIPKIFAKRSALSKRTRTLGHYHTDAETLLTYADSTTGA